MTPSKLYYVGQTFTLAIGATSNSESGLFVEETFDFVVGVSCLEADVSVATPWLGNLTQSDASSITVGESAVISVTEPTFSSSSNT